jgi:hypothetical protein
MPLSAKIREAFGSFGNWRPFRRAEPNWTYFCALRWTSAHYSVLLCELRIVGCQGRSRVDPFAPVEN